MRTSRFSEEQIIGVLKEHQAGLPVVELCRKSQSRSLSRMMARAAPRPATHVLRGQWG